MMMINFIKKHKFLVYIFLFILFITGLRFLWISFFNTPHVFSKQGDVVFEEEIFNHAFFLDGEWDFYPSVLLNPESLSTYQENPVPIKVPGNWNHIMDQNNPGKGFGTYVLNIQLPKNFSSSYAFYFSSIRNASKIFINEQLVHQSGQVSSEEHTYRPHNLPVTILSNDLSDTREVQLIVQVSNFIDSRGGGIVRAVQFGTADHIQKNVTFSTSSQIVTLLFFSIISLFSLLIYFITVFSRHRNKNTSFLYFSCLIFSLAAIFFLSSDDKLIHQWTNVSYEHSFIWVNIFQTISGLCLMKMTLHARNHYLKTTYYTLGISTIFLAFIIPNHLLIKLSFVYSLYLLISVITLSYVLFKGIRTKDKNNIFFILSIISVLNHLIWWTISLSNGLTVPHYPFDLIFSVFFIGVFWFNAYAKLFSEVHSLNEELVLQSQAKEEFITISANQMIQPLQSLININQQIISKQSDSKVVQELEQTRSIATHLSIVTKNIADVITFNADKKEESLIPVAIQYKIETVQKLLKNYFPSHNVIFKNNLSTTPQYIMGITNYFIEMMYNIHYFILKRKADSCSISTNYDSDKINIAFEIKGSQIEKIDHCVVEMTYKELIDNNILFTDEFDIELNLAKKLAHLQNASIHFTQGKDSLIISCLFEQATSIPLNLKDTKNKVPNKQTCIFDTVNHHSTENTRILLLGSQNIHTKILSDLLKEANYECEVIECEEKATYCIETEKWDLIIVDPFQSNVDYLSWIRKTRKKFSLIQLPILYLSTWGNLNENHYIFEVGANDFIQKPVDGRELIARVNTLTLMKNTVDQTIELEAAWLQSQISPHFLFNTLNTIIALQSINEEQMYEVLDAFMTVLQSKFKFKDATERIPLEEELSLVQSYLFIEEQRFPDQLTVKYEIDDTVTIDILPLTLQPLVENAIRHGILPKGEPGQLTIRVIDLKDGVRIEVEDDGKGMHEEEIQLLLKNEFEKRRGIGVVNTNKRLQKEFDTHLKIKSTLNKGTTFYFTLPKNH